jgi:hypothetical protein
MSGKQSRYWVEAEKKKIPPLKTQNPVAAPATSRSMEWAVSASKQVMFF